MYNRFAASDIRWENHKDHLFHSCEHCLHWKEPCKKLELKLKRRKTGWSCSEETNCETWEKI